MNLLKKLFFLLPVNQRSKALLLLVLMIFMALVDVIGVASILPFMAVITNPDLIETNSILNKFYLISNKYGVANDEQFFFVLGIVVFFLLVFSLTLKTLTTYFQLRFVWMQEKTIGKRLLESYLHQPYSWFLDHNSSNIGKNILSDVGHVVQNGINPAIVLLADGFVAIALITLLIIANPIIALSVCFTLILSYILIYSVSRRYLNKIGEQRSKNNNLRFNAIIEAFGAAKEIKLGGLEPNYINKFSIAAKNFAHNQASSQIMALTPRYILEGIAFGGILLVLLYLISSTGSFNNAIPLISLYVLAGYKLMPALQHIYQSLSQLRYAGPALNTLEKDINNSKHAVHDLTQKKMNLAKSISLKNIFYKYPNSSRNVLDNINLTIAANTTVGIIGPTGSGKTTVVDIILGLLVAQEGHLEVDGKVITKTKSRVWQRLIGYVPQNIYLSDDTVASNIAFGVSNEDVDQTSIEKASKIANLHNFVVEELPNQYQTVIGERGVKLSGGQRQRIGIARALYFNPQVLILDEATSSLDNQTEKAVMDAVNKLMDNTTIIMIAHRLNTVRNCDNIFHLNKGKIINQGTFEQLNLK